MKRLDEWTDAGIERLLIALGEPFFIENKIKQFKAETAKADSAIGEIIPRSIQTQGNA